MAKNLLFLLYIWICSVYGQLELGQNLPYRYQIYNKIFFHYNKNMRPTNNQSAPTIVTIDPALYSIEEINEVHETIKYNQWYHVEWNDPYLIWDVRNFGGVSTIEVPAGILWVPDITVFGLLEVKETPVKEATFCDVYSHGVVHCSFNQIITTHCEFFILLFPFDTQNCTLKYGSWKYGLSQIDLKTNNTTSNVDFFQENTEWELISMSNHRTVTNYTREAFVDIVYGLVIKRKPLYYVLTLVLPSFIITSIAIVGLFSPFNATGDRQEKVSMGLTTLLTMAVLLLVVSDQMPKTSAGLPLIGIYILIEISVASFASCVTVLIMRLHRKAWLGHPVPQWLITLTRVKVETVQDQTDFSSNLETIPIEKFAENKKENDQNTYQIMQKHSAAMLASCMSILLELKTHIEQKKNDAKIYHLWAIACDRLDVGLMVQPWLAAFESLREKNVFRILSFFLSHGDALSDLNNLLVITNSATTSLFYIKFSSRYRSALKLLFCQAFCPRRHRQYQLESNLRSRTYSFAISEQKSCHVSPSNSMSNQVGQSLLSPVSEMPEQSNLLKPSYSGIRSRSSLISDSQSNLDSTTEVFRQRSNTNNSAITVTVSVHCEVTQV